MSSPGVASVVIACPNCGTRYQLPFGAVGAAGRDVQCAQCGTSWHASAEGPPPVGDEIFGAADEAALDAAFEREAGQAAAPPPAPSRPLDHQKTIDEIKAAIAPKAKPAAPVDPALLQSRRDFVERQADRSRQMPLARLRRTARLGALIALLSVLVLGFSLRADLVTWFPQLAGLYAAIGLPVNVVGLEFTEAKTLTSLRNGKTVMQITARIRSLSSRTVTLPPVLVSLLDAGGRPVYEWTVPPRTGEMEPGEIIDFATEVNAPPDAAVTVRLSFADSAAPAASLPPKA
ncbi:MAG: zinc-ribbon domain-containing protein [Devosia sp.]